MNEEVPEPAPREPSAEPTPREPSAEVPDLESAAEAPPLESASGLRPAEPAPLELTPSEQDLAERLSAQRPVPAPAFRGALKRRLQARDPGYRTRPPRLRPMVSAYLGAGAALIALGALEAAGVL
ncbi:MAG: hypothetical protein ACR2IP_10135 [Solirubrobacteraceae bacterium]